MRQSLITLVSFKEYIDKAGAWLDENVIQQVIAFFSSLNVWMQAGILVLAALLILLGLILFIKRFFKAFVVIGILAALGIGIYLVVTGKNPFSKSIDISGVVSTLLSM